MISTVSSVVAVDERVRRKSRGLHQRVLACSGTSLWNIQKDEHGDFVRGGTPLSSKQGLYKAHLHGVRGREGAAY